MSNIKFPDITVQLTGQNGNVLNLASIVSRSLKRAGHAEAAKELVDAVLKCKSYDEALRLMMSTVNVE